MKRIIKNFISAPLALLVFLAIIFEEWVWRHAKAALHRALKALHLEVLENYLRGAPIWVCAPLFIVPGLVLFPFKLGALYLISHGQAVLGIGLFMLAKVVGAALLGWVWSLTSTTLKRVYRIKWVVVNVLRYKRCVKRWAKSTAVFVWAKAQAHKVRVKVKERIAAWSGEEGTRSRWARLVRKLAVRYQKRVKSGSS